MALGNSTTEGAPGSHTPTPLPHVQHKGAAGATMDSAIAGSLTTSIEGRADLAAGILSAGRTMRDTGVVPGLSVDEAVDAAMGAMGSGWCARQSGARAAGSGGRCVGPRPSGSGANAGMVARGYDRPVRGLEMNSRAFLDSAAGLVISQFTVAGLVFNSICLNLLCSREMSSSTWFLTGSEKCVCFFSCLSCLFSDLFFPTAICVGRT